jgi:hypothetical protein
LRDLGRAHPNLCDAGLELSTAFVAFVTLKSYVAGHTEWTIADGGMGSHEPRTTNHEPRTTNH